MNNVYSGKKYKQKYSVGKQQKKAQKLLKNVDFYGCFRGVVEQG